MKEVLQNEYSVFYSNSKNGRRRLIQVPFPPLKEKQKELIKLYEQFPLHNACSCKKGSGPLDAAQPHFGSKFLLKVDISNCFQRVEIAKVRKVISNADINSSLKTQMLENLDVCFIHWNGKDILPTGSPTSPILCNISLSEIDYTINDIALDNNYKYTRYMDDLNLSTTDEKRTWELIAIISNILAFAGYPTNIHKTRWYGRGDNDAKIVAGINLKTILKRDVKRMIRARLNNLAKSREPLDSKTQGYLAYIKSIDSSIYQSLLQYYAKRIEYHLTLTS